METFHRFPEPLGILEKQTSLSLTSRVLLRERFLSETPYSRYLGIKELRTAYHRRRRSQEGYDDAFFGRQEAAKALFQVEREQSFPGLANS